MLLNVEIQVASAQHRWEEAERHAETTIAASEGDTLALVDPFEALARMAMTQGRLEEAERHWRTHSRSAPRRARSGVTCSASARLAGLELRYRQSPARALAIVDSALARTPLDSLLPGDRPYDELARFYATAGRLDARTRARRRRRGERPRARAAADRRARLDARRDRAGRRAARRSGEPSCARPPRASCARSVRCPISRAPTRRDGKRRAASGRLRALPDDAVVLAVRDRTRWSWGGAEAAGGAVRRARRARRRRRGRAHGWCSSGVARMRSCSRSSRGHERGSVRGPGDLVVRHGGDCMFTLSSSAFASGDAIPKRYTCDDANVSPPLAWSGAPSGTKSFALIVDDPDAPDPAAPKRVYVHWVLYDIPATVTELAEGAAQRRACRCARCVERRQEPRLERALSTDRPSPLLPQAVRAGRAARRPRARRREKADVERAMAGHVLATAELMGTYAALTWLTRRAASALVARRVASRTSTSPS